METKFEDLKVSTRTIIATARVEFDIVKIFDKMPMVSRRFQFGGKEYATRMDSMYYKNKMRISSETIPNTNTHKSFRNALNVIMMISDTKKVNFKVSKNGKFQITGCREIEHAMVCVYSFLDVLYESSPDSIFLTGTDFNVFFEVVMTNVDCGTGYCIDRQALDKIVNTSTPYHSLLETSFGYTGVNIKFPVQLDWYNMNIPAITWTPGKIDTLHIYQTPLSSVRENNNKKKFNTFLVFHSGQFIMSGMREETMKDDYYRFINILKDNHEEIKEVLENV